MVKKNNIQEQMEMISYLMSYDRNLILSEQTAFERQLDRTFSTPEGAHEYIQSQGKMVKDLLDKIAEMPLSHNQLAAIEIITGVLALIPTPASPFLYGISISAGLLDANKYRAEGDPHSAWIALFLTVIPEVKLGKLMKGAKYSKKELSALYKRYKNGAKLTDDELKAVYELEQAAATAEGKAVIDAAAKLTVKEYLKLNIKNKPLRWLVLFLYNGAKLGLWELPKVAVMVSGVYIGADQLYLYIWGNDADRQKSDLKQVADIVQNFSTDLYNKLLGKAEEVSNTVSTEKYDKAMENVDYCDHTVQTAEDYLNPGIKTDSVFTGPSNNQSTTKPEFQWKPTSLTKEKIANGEGYIKSGMSGPVVKELQQKLNYELYTDDDGNPLNPDGQYGQKTKQAVKSFQSDNGLNDDGIAGQDTFKNLFNL